MANYHRRYSGARIENPTAIGGVGGGPLPVDPSPAEAEYIARSIEAFRYVALLANHSGFGANSTHLHVEHYEFSEGTGRYLNASQQVHERHGHSKPPAESVGPH